MGLPPYNPPPPVKEGRGLLFWVAAGCGGCLTGLVVLVAVIYLIVAGVMRKSTPVQDGVARARADARVVAALGQPIEIGIFFMGSIKAENRDGSADISVPLSGPKAKGSLHIVGTKRDGTWSYEELTVTPNGGVPIDLMKR